MLVLTRKKHESIVIGDDIRVTVVEIAHGHIRLGIEAPKEVAVRREEICEDICADHRSQPSPTRVPRPIR